MPKSHQSAKAAKGLRVAVLELRNRLGLTQTQFGGRIGKGLASIQRYEGLVPPKGRVLAKLVRLADLHKQPDLAEVFRLALSAEVGMDVALSPMVVGYEFEPEHQADADAFFEMIHGPQWKSQRDEWARISGPIKDALAVAARDVDDNEEKS